MAWWFLGWLLLAGVAFGQRSRPFERLPMIPPAVIEQSVTVERGGTVTIPLGIRGTRAGTMTFLIRTPPKAGKVSEVVSLSRETAEVRYTPPPETAVVEERFTYAVQTAEGVSAPATVIIRIIDPLPPSPLLEVPDTVDFGSLVQGGFTVRKIVLKNIGGGLVSGEIAATVPWRVEGKRNYALGAGESQEFTIGVLSQFVGNLTGELRYSSSPDRVTLLRMECYSAVDARDSTIQLYQNPDETFRQGSVEVFSRVAVPLAIRVRCGPRVTATPASFTIAPRGSATVILRTLDGDLAPFQEPFYFCGEGVTLRIVAEAAPASAILRFGAARILFGADSVTGRSRACVDLMNLGATPVTVALNTSAPFKLEVARAVVRPGEQLPVCVVLRDWPPGGAHGVLEARSGATVTKVDLVAAIADPGSAGSASGRSASGKTVRATRIAEQPATSLPVVGSAGADGGSWRLEELDPSMRPLEPGERVNRAGTQVRRGPKDSWVISWPGSWNQGESLALFFEELGFGSDGALKRSWSPVSSVEFRTAGDHAEATVHGLLTGRAYTLQVRRTGDPQLAESLAAVCTVRFAVTSPPGVMERVGSVLPWIGGGLAFGLLLFVLRRRRLAGRKLPR
jgi:hypothetical protein